MRKILLRSLLLCAMMVVLLVPGSASAKTANASVTKDPKVDGASYTTAVKIHLKDIPEDGIAKASEAIKFPTTGGSYVSISSTGYSTYFRVKFSLLNGAEVESVVATVTKSGVSTPVTLDLSDTASSGLLTYRGKISGTVTQVDINLLHACKYDYTEIPATTTEATCTEDATKTSTCVFCNGTKTEVTKKATGHAFTKKLVDAKYLKSAATCTEDAVYVYSCCYCGEAGTETFEDTGSAGHDWGKYEITTAPTCTVVGEKTRTCKTCQATDTEEIPATGHDYTKEDAADKYLKTAATCTADGTKTAACDFCKTVKNTVTDPGSAKGHQWNNGVVTKEPTEDETGSKTFTCKTCNATYTEEIPVKEHTHSFAQKVADSKYLAKTATCTSAALYHLSCTCGESGTETFASGSPLPHSFTNYVYDGNATCTADGTKTATCDSCGQAKDTVAAEGTATGHLWDKGQVTTEPTVDHEGEMNYTCQNCQATKTETLAKLESEKPNPVDPTPGLNDPTTPADPSKDKTTAGNQTLTASTDAAKNLEKQTETSRTSDDSALMLWTALLLLSGVSFTSAGLIRRCR